MALAAVACAAGFPQLATGKANDSTRVTPLSRETWLVIFGVILMALNQAMVFSFVERIGFDRGYGDKVTAVLIATGFVNLLSPILAGVLQNRLSARIVTIIGPLLQGVLACLIVFVVTFQSYAFATAIYIAVMIFTHTFAFGLLAKLDSSGRAAAATAR